MRQTGFVGFRVQAADIEKLERLALQTERSKSAVLRLLLAQAELRPELDIKLAQGNGGKQGGVEVRG